MMMLADSLKYSPYPHIILITDCCYCSMCHECLMDIINSMQYLCYFKLALQLAIMLLMMMVIAMSQEDNLKVHHSRAEEEEINS